MKDPTSIVIGIRPRVQYEIQEMLRQYVGLSSSLQARESMEREADRILLKHLLAGHGVVEAIEADRD